MNVTVSAYNRPEYLARTLAALRSCEGIADCRVMVLIDPSEHAYGCESIATRYGFPAAKYEQRVGCNRAIREALTFGFNQMAGEYHVHLEDDTVPCRDALQWFAWAGNRYRDDPRVMNVSGYQRSSNGCVDECGIRRWFTPWGWGIWRDRWLGLHLGWAKGDETSWDVIVNHALRAGRYEAFPTVSRIQNIGAEKGTHVPDAEWHHRNHWVPVTADDLRTDPVEEWRHVVEADGADHA